MNDDSSEGTVQPGTRRTGRRGQRRTPRRPETFLGINNANVEGEIGNENDDVVVGNRPLPRVDELQGCQCLCIWPKDRISIQRMWLIVKQALRPHGDRVRKIYEVNQPGRVVRFDIYVERRNYAWLCRGLRAQAGRLRFMVKRDEKFWVRRTKRVRTPLVVVDRELQPQSRVKIASWNIHSIAEKRDEVGMYLHKNGVEVLALQETWRTVSHWPLRLKGFNVFESVAEKGVSGVNGVALCVSNKLVAYEIGEVSQYAVTVRIMVGTVEWNIMSVYVPPRGPAYAQRDAFTQIRRAIRRLVDRDLGVKIAIIGDWNTKAEALGRRLQRWRLPLSIVPFQGSPLTHMRRNSWSAIDHMVMTYEAVGWAGKCRVNRTWDLSDHWPVENTIRGVLPEVDVRQGEDDGNVQLLGAGIRMDVHKLPGERHRIVDDNRWSVLAVEDEGDNDGVNNDPLADLVENTVRGICEEVEVMKPPPTDSKGPTYRLSRGAKIAIGRRRKAYREWLKREAPENGGPGWMRYLHCKAVAAKAKRQASQESWLRHIANGAKALSDNDMEGFWKWVKSTTQRGKTGPSDMGPLQSPIVPQELVYQPREKLMAWKTHYERLLADVTGHSRDAQYWGEQFQGAPLPPIEGLNEDITWVELNVALHKLKNHKAPGGDGIPSEFYKLAAENEDEQGGGREQPHTAMGSALLRMVNRLFKKGIPSKWNEAWVVSIPKSGDPTDMNNYRGISLIGVAVKLTTSIVTTRLTLKLEESEFFIREQAGFRWREECAGHVCALYEILRRREIMGEDTFVAFIDIRKAYDTVPIEGLLRKLYMIGVSGTALEYFRSLYTGATVRVRTKYGLSGVVPLMRGLRQGCNASPLLFDIFINDILDGCEALGVKVMGLVEGKLVGLLYADDLVLTCDDCQSLQRALDLIQEWANKHEMTFGVNKCGVMGFGPNGMDMVRDRVWTLGDEIVPVVEEYDYLGIPFTGDLDLAVVAKARAAKGIKVLNSKRAMLGCLQIPIDIRVRAVKAMVVPVLTYGGELWGLQDQRMSKPQSVLSEALRVLARLRVRSVVTSSAALGLEFGIPPISALVAAAKTRALKKFPTLRTVIAVLIRAPPRGRLRSWVSGTTQWLMHYCRDAYLAEDPGVAASIVKKYMWARFNVNAKSKRYVFYRDNGLEGSRRYLAVATHNPSIARGIYWLCRFRVGAVWLARRLATIRFIDQVYRTRCPFCNEEVVETVEHLLLQCTRWREHRTSYWGESMTGLTVVQLLGGSNGEGGVEGEGVDFVARWCPENTRRIEADLRLPHRVNGIVGSLPICVLVAQYLQVVMPIRFGLLHALIEVPRADAAEGMAVLTGPIAHTPEGDVAGGIVNDRGGTVADFDVG